MIKVYTVNNCPFCTEMKKLITDKGLTFEEVNINENEAVGRDLLKLIGAEELEVPLVLVGKALLVPGNSFQTIPEGANLVAELSAKL